MFRIVLLFFSCLLHCNTNVITGKQIEGSTALTGYAVDLFYQESQFVDMALRVKW